MEQIGRKLLFSFDTGATSSVFSVRYYREFPSAFRSLKRKSYGVPDAGGVKNIPAYVLPQAVLTVGEAKAALHWVAVIPVPIGTGLDKVYGNPGRDLISGFRSFTLDFVNMRFTLEPASTKPIDVIHSV